jgi:hypothetical protein
MRKTNEKAEKTEFAEGVFCYAFLLLLCTLSVSFCWKCLDYIMATNG